MGEKDVTKEVELEDEVDKMIQEIFAIIKDHEDLCQCRDCMEFDILWTK